jgi:ribosomal silencing factor RsfS
MNERIINKALCFNSPKAKVQKEKENENQYHVFFLERKFLHIFAFEKKTYFEFEKLLLNLQFGFLSKP